MQYVNAYQKIYLDFGCLIEQNSGEPLSLFVLVCPNISHICHEICSSFFVFFNVYKIKKRRKKCKKKKMKRNNCKHFIFFLFLHFFFSLSSCIKGRFFYRRAYSYPSFQGFLIQITSKYLRTTRFISFFIRGHALSCYRALRFEVCKRINVRYSKYVTEMLRRTK